MDRPNRYAPAGGTVLASQLRKADDLHAPEQVSDVSGTSGEPRCRPHVTTECVLCPHKLACSSVSRTTMASCCTLQKPAAPPRSTRRKPRRSKQQSNLRA